MVAPAMEVNPAGQLVHRSPALAANVPAGQLVQLPDPDGEEEPALHGVQVAAAAEEYWPAGHEAHAEAPGSPANVPAGQLVQAADPGAPA